MAEPSDLEVLIGLRLRQRRRLLNLTQAQVAEQMGVRFQQVQKYECGSNRLSVCRFLAFCRAVQASAADILYGLQETSQ